MGTLHRAVTSVIFTLAAALVAIGGMGFLFYGMFQWLLESGTTVSGAAFITGIVTLLAAIPVYLFGHRTQHHLHVEAEEEQRGPRSAFEELMLAFASGFMASPDKEKQKEKRERVTETATGRDEAGQRVHIVKRTRRVEHPATEDEPASLEVRATSTVTPIKSASTSTIQ